MHKILQANGQLDIAADHAAFGDIALPFGFAPHVGSIQR
jgi:hypothetical protein